MKHLLNLLAAVALLVWGTHLVRTGVLRVFGANLRKILVQSMRNRFTAALSGIGVTALVQSSTATSLITSSFVGQGLVTLPAALAVCVWRRRRPVASAKWRCGARAAGLGRCGGYCKRAGPTWARR